MALAPLFRRALDGKEKLHGAEHANTLMSVNNLGMLYGIQGKYEEAEPLFERALDVLARLGARLKVRDVAFGGAPRERAFLRDDVVARIRASNAGDARSEAGSDEGGQQ